MKWFVCKTVKEYHYFSIEADTEEEAWDIAAEEYCEPSEASHTDIEVEYVRIVKEEEE
jgi:hypothetical protein|tara:strand:- start:253 stop:426 length:174 start_codon:yes stop_codon:yes gene_type:complete